MIVVRGAQGIPLRVNGGPNNIDAAHPNLLRLKLLAIPTCTKVTLLFTDFREVDPDQDIEAFELAINEFPVETRIKASTAWTGGGSATATLSAGIAGTLDKFLPAFDIFQPVGDTVRSRDAQASRWPESTAAVTSLRVNLVSDVNVSLLTAGRLDLYVWTVTLP